MKKFVIIPLTLLLIGCNSTTQNVVSTKLTVVTPDESLYTCPIVKQYPDPNKLTDIQVARLLVTLYQNNITCKNSIDAIKKFLDDSKASIEK